MAQQTVSTDSLSDTALRERVEQSLLEARVWKLSSYGWKDAYTVDPEYIGHAIWQTDPPVSIDYLAWSVQQSGTKPPPPPLSQRQQMLSVAGADFDGLMDCARMSIGMLLLQIALVRENQFHDDSFLDLHRMSAIIYLSTASERIREYFIAAVFEQAQPTYHGRGEFGALKRSWYTTPFLEAATRCRDVAEAAEAQRKLESYAEQVRTLRDTRNEIVHKLATEIGRRERHLVEESLPRREPLNVDLAAIREAARQSQTKRYEELDAIIAQLTEWYELLARTSNEVFIVERWLRPQD